GGPHPEEKAVDRSPRLDAERLPDGPRIRPDGPQRVPDGTGILLIPHQVLLDQHSVLHALLAEALLEVLFRAGHDQQRPPALQALKRDVQHEGEVDTHQSGGVVHPLDVSVEPEATVGDACDHSAAPSSTQVSLDPPPWLELTTYDPSRRATRVSPPGSTQEVRPVTM